MDVNSVDAEILCFLIFAAIYLLKKLASILLLTCLCCSLLGYHVIYFFQIKKAKSEMVSFLKNLKQHKDVVELSFSNDELENTSWENDHEFSYHNKMYDVIEKKTVGDHLLVRCISDDKETQLVKDFQKSNHHRSNETMIQLITTPFLLPEDQMIKQPERMVNKFFGEHFFFLHQIAASIFIPPPEVC